MAYYKLNFRRASDVNILKSSIRIVKLITKNNCLGQSPSWEATITQPLENSQHFIEPKYSLLCSQEPATSLYPKPDKSGS
jgi:hypothetical protein